MSDGGFTIVDGSNLRSLRLSLPESSAPLTGADLLDFADSKLSGSLFGLPLPLRLKSSALLRLNLGGDLDFRRTYLTGDAAAAVLGEYVTAIADELNENPLVVSVLDGNTVKLFLEDEDDFAMLAENLFTDLDTLDKGKIRKSEVRNALVLMGVEMGIPPLQELPMLNDILKHGAEGDEEVGQSQFAELLQPVLQEIADTLAQKNIVVLHNIKIVNGSKLRKVLSDDKQLDEVAEKILQEKLSKNDDNENNMKKIRAFLEKNGKELGLPPFEANDTVSLLYDSVFADIDTAKFAAESKEEIRVVLKEMLEKFAEQLKANPVYCDPEI